jgi:hypothetical protein
MGTREGDRQAPRRAPAGGAANGAVNMTCVVVGLPCRHSPRSTGYIRMRHTYEYNAVSATLYRSNFFLKKLSVLIQEYTWGVKFPGAHTRTPVRSISDREVQRTCPWSHEE